MSRAWPQIALFVLLSLVAFAAGAVEVRELRVATGAERTRLVLDLSASVDYKLFSLENPHRIVIDLKSASLGRAARVPDFQPGLLQRLRTGVQNGRDLRVVLDLQRGVRPRSFIEPPGDGRGHRLVIDLPNQTSSPSMPATAVAIPVRSARQAPSRRTSPWRWRAKWLARSTPCAVTGRC